MARPSPVFNIQPDVQSFNIRHRQLYNNRLTTERAINFAQRIFSIGDEPVRTKINSPAVAKVQPAYRFGRSQRAFVEEVDNTTKSTANLDTREKAVMETVPLWHTRGKSRFNKREKLPATEWVKWPAVEIDSAQAGDTARERL